MKKLKELLNSDKFYNIFIKVFYVLLIIIFIGCAIRYIQILDFFIDKI